MAIGPFDYFRKVHLKPKNDPFIIYSNDLNLWLEKFLFNASKYIQFIDGCASAPVPTFQ